MTSALQKAVELKERLYKRFGIWYDFTTVSEESATGGTETTDSEIKNMTAKKKTAVEQAALNIGTPTASSVASQTAKPAGKPAVEVGKPEAEQGKSNREAVVEVQTKHEIAIKKLAGEIIQGLVEVGNKYLNLCTYIRSNQVEKSLATKYLLDMGFSKPRASEVCTVASLPDEAWNSFAARQLGWRGALQIGRGNMEEMKKVSPALVDPELVKEITAELVKEEEKKDEELNDKYAGMDEKERAAAIAKEKKAAWTEAMDTAAAKLLQKAALVGVKKQKQWDIANGYLVILKPVGKVEVKPGQAVVTPK